MKIRPAQKGQILVLVVIILSAVLLNSVLLIGSSQLFTANSQNAVGLAQATSLAEAGMEKAVSSLNATGGSYSGDSEVNLEGGSFSVDMTTIGIEKEIEVTGYVPSKTEAEYKKTIKIRASKGEGVSFNYGILVGEGGLEMDNGNQVKGSVYSNGNITAVNGNQIIGDAWIAGGTASVANQQTECTASCSDYIFGKTSGSILDVAQSFKPSQTQVINKVSLKLKKVGSPPDVTVRLMKNTGTEPTNKPDKNNVLTSGTINSSLVTSSYGWIDVTFASSPTLTAGTIYWIMIDTSFNSSNYWLWENDNISGYLCGGSTCYAKWSANWSAGSPVWSNITGDLSFKVFMGGVITQLSGGNAFTVTGDVHANTIKNTTINKDAYYQTLTNSTVLGTKFPGSADPPPENFPISDANISDWKDSASGFGNLPIPDCSTATVWGPGKYNGDISLGNACKENLKTPIWITGSLTFTNGNELKLDPSMGSTSGVVIIDNRVIFGNSTKLSGSGTTGSFLTLLSLYDSRTNGISAMDVNNGVDGGILYADKGMVDIKNGNKFKELIAWKIKLKNGIQLEYDSGLAGIFFSSGPSGSYSIIKGTYQIK